MKVQKRTDQNLALLYSLVVGVEALHEESGKLLTKIEWWNKELAKVKREVKEAIVTEHQK